MAIIDKATVTYSFYVESNNQSATGLTPVIQNFYDITDASDLVANPDENVTVPTIVELEGGFYKFEFEWDRSNSPEAYLIKIDTTLSEPSEKTITMRIERADYVSDAIKRIVDIEQGTWEIDSDNFELVIKHATSGEELGRWELFDSSGEVKTTRNPFYRRAKTISPY